MKIEVEHKYRVEDEAALRERLMQLGAEPQEPEAQVDTYYGHPSRDFAQTDEALRIRQIGPRNYVTYKGPKLDATTKTRRELELPLESGDAGAAAFAELLVALGFRRVRDVRKNRRHFAIAWEGRQVDAAMDYIEGLGHFFELELSVEDSDVPAAKACLASLAERLQLKTIERRSYLEMLIEAAKA
jgi:adenylate cyclase class 2